MGLAAPAPASISIAVLLLTLTVASSGASAPRLLRLPVSSSRNYLTKEEHWLNQTLDHFSPYVSSFFHLFLWFVWLLLATLIGASLRDWKFGSILVACYCWSFNSCLIKFFVGVSVEKFLFWEDFSWMLPF